MSGQLDFMSDATKRNMNGIELQQGRHRRFKEDKPVENQGDEERWTMRKYLSRSKWLQHQESSTNSLAIHEFGHGLTRAK